MTDDKAYIVGQLEHAIYWDHIPPACIAEHFGMDHADDQINTLVLGVWQGAVKYSRVVRLDEVGDALEENTVKELFHKATHLLALRGNSYAARLLDKLDSLEFVRCRNLCGWPYEEECEEGPVEL